jgi:hypothetical protein
MQISPKIIKGKTGASGIVNNVSRERSIWAKRQQTATMSDLQSYKIAAS